MVNIYNTTLPGKLFLGLGSMHNLSLANNHLYFLESGSFNGLVSLKTLWLSGNCLSFLSQDLVYGLPTALQLILNDPFKSDPPWNCTNLCWLKQLELKNTVRWLFQNDVPYKPWCTGDTMWDILHCTGYFLVLLLPKLKFWNLNLSNWIQQFDWLIDFFW